MLKRSGYSILVIILCTMLVSCTKEQPKEPEKAIVAEETTPVDTSPVVAEIGDEKITLSQLDRAVKRLPLPYQERFKTEEGQKYVLDDLITIALLSREAQSLKLDQKPEIKEQLEGIRKRILSAEVLKAELAKEPVPGEKDARQYYELNRAQFTKLEQVKLRKIVVPTIQEGNVILKALEEGGDFAQLAREKSIDPTRASGGYVGWVGRDRVKPETVFDLEKGEFSELIRTANGYAIMFVEDKKPATLVDYNLVEPAIIRRLRAEQEEKVLGSLRTRLFKEMKVTIHEDRLKQVSPQEDKKQ